MSDEPNHWAAEVMRLRDRLAPIRDARAAERSAAQREVERARAARLRAANRERAVAQIPPRFTAARPDHPDVLAWVTAVTTQRLDRRSRDSLVLLGRTGVGKTWQAYGAFRAVAEALGCTAVAVDVPTLLDSLRPGRPAAVDYAAVESADLLLLDDLAAERDTEWTAEQLYRLIDARWRNVAPTIITSNATPDLIAERLGPRTASRLAGMGMTVVLSGPDRRLAPPPRT